MASRFPDGGLDPSSRALLDKLDELLVGCIPKEVEHAHGVDYTVGLDELKKVKLFILPCSDPYLLSKAFYMKSPHQFGLLRGVCTSVLKNRKDFFLFFCQSVGMCKSHG